MTTRRAACSCGQLHLVAEGDPIRISMCHCLACQRRTGSTFGAQARFPRDKVHVEGRSTQYVRTGDSGNQATFHFCPDCGATVYYLLGGIPDAIAVPVGAFADPTFPAPKISVYEERKHAWTGIPADAEHID
ncbi:MAG: GFA family protein [Minicystis sp.]